MSAQQRASEAAAKLLGEAPVGAFAFGRAHARMTNGAWWLVGLFGAGFVIVLIVLKTLLLPGVVLIWILVGMVRPRRGIAVTDAGVAVLAVSGWSGRPARITERLPHAALRSGIRRVRGSRVDVQLGADLITMRSSDFGRLTEAVPADAIPPPPPGTVAS